MSNSEFGIKDIIDNPKSILYVLNPQEKLELQDHISFSHYRRNEYIYKEGDRPAGFLILVDGKVKIFKEGVGGREQIIRLEKPLGVIGYRALLGNEPHLTSAVTIEESIVCSVSQEFIVNRALKNGDFSLRIINKLSKELGFTYSRTVALTQKHVRGRLAEALLLLRDIYGVEEDGVTLKIFLSREEIANLSNMTTSNAIRTLSTFGNEKAISIDGRKIKILDASQLERASKIG